MPVQGSPAEKPEIKIIFPEEGPVLLMDDFEESSPAEKKRPDRRKKSRWSLETLLIGNCPEFIESFA